MAYLTIRGPRITCEINEPGVHPYLSFFLPGEDSAAVISGARQLQFFHKGASFPRILTGGEREQESGALLDFTVHPGGDGVTISDMRAGLSITTRIAISDGPSVHVLHRLEATEAVSINRVFDRFDFLKAMPGAPGSEGLEYWHVPHLRPKEGMTISDHVFRSPCVIMQRGQDLFALVPDLDFIEETYRASRARYHLDFLISGGENHSPTVCLGIGGSRPCGHLYFRSDFRRPIKLEEGSHMVLAYYLFLSGGDLQPRDIVSFLWERYGRPRLESGGPQVAVWDRYAAAGLSRIFKSQDLFRKFMFEGQPCGGTVGIHFITRRGVRLMSCSQLERYLRLQDPILAAGRYLIDRMGIRAKRGRLMERLLFRYGPRVPPQILFQAWFNNLRSAYGAYWFARKWQDVELLKNALEVKNLAVLAPRERGAFPAVCYATDEKVFWSEGTKGFSHVDWYNTADCSTTGYYMGLWYADHEGDPRLLARARELADFLLKVQLPSGAFPTWVRPSAPDLRIAPELKESATTACPAMFLALLYSLEPEERYIDAAVRACGFLSKEVIPRQKWFDYETFYSCSFKRTDMFDPNTGTYPQNTMSMYWAAEAFRLLHAATGDGSFLERGLQVLDELCLYLQVWDPPFLSINAFGGFGVMNTDGEWNDARQAVIAPVLMDYYTATGNPEYMERGIAALKASFITMFLDENRVVAPGNMRGVPREEYGSVAENYAHFGYDDRVPGFIDSDWGAGSSCFAAAYAQKHYGDLYVDAERMKAFGVNGCRVASLRRDGERLLLDVDVQVEPGFDAAVRVRGAWKGIQVLVNEKPARRTPAGDFLALL